jgi:hypothetical protein
MRADVIFNVSQASKRGRVHYSNCIVTMRWQSAIVVV